MSRTGVLIRGLVLLLASIVVIPGLVPALYGAVALAWPLLWSPIALLIALVPGLVVPVSCLFIRWDKEPTPGARDAYVTIRGDLPQWCRWLLQTIDERLPGGCYEPAVVKVLDRFGRYWCSVYWLGLRNRSHGLRRTCGKPSTWEAYRQRFEADEEGRIDGVRVDGSWYRERRLGPFKRVSGFRIYMTLEGEFLAAPTATIKRA